MQKNVASQKLVVFAFDSTTNSPKTGDSANITAYVSKDFGAVTVLGDTTATEMDSTNAKGYYLFDLTQGETNADALLFSAKSSTSNIVVIGCPAYVQTVPSAFALAGGASGGFLISGSNSGTTTLAALTVTGSMTVSDGLLVSRSTSNASAITATGNGTGSGIVATSGSGATGDGIQATAASTNGNGFVPVGTGTGSGLKATGGATGHGVLATGGATSGDGIRSTAATSGIGLNAIGIGTTQPGIKGTGGTTTSAGLSLVGGGTSGDGMLIATTSGHGINVSGAGTTKHGIFAQGGATTSAGIAAAGGGTSGDGILITATSGHGISSTGAGTTKHGIHAAGGSTTSHGINAIGGGVGHGILATSGSGATGDGIKGVAASTNGNGLNLAGVGTGAGLLATGGATGIGLSAVGGATSGDAIKAVTTSGHGLNLAPVGTSKHGIFATGGNGGTSDGISAVAGTGGVPIRGDITGNITGNLSGTVTTVTTLTNLPAITANWLTATGIASDAITAAKIADGAIDRATFAADTGLQNIRANTAQAGGATSITLDASASATTNYYINDLIYITGGTGVGQSRFCTAYNGTTKVATVNSAWATNPDNTSTFAVIPFDSIPGATAPTAAQVATAVFTDLTAGSDFSTVGSFGKLVKDYLDAAVSSRMATFTVPANFSALAITAGGIVSANTTQLGGSATPVTNMGIVFNTDFATNYNTTLDMWNVNVEQWNAQDAATVIVSADMVAVGGNTASSSGAINFDNLDAAVSSRSSHTAANVWAAATRTLTSCDVTAISGDATAADNLESYLDGTNFMPVDAHKPIFLISGATLTVKKPDGTTTAYTRTLATDAAAEPVIGSS